MSSRRGYAAKVYEAADLWIASALKSDDSLFTPGTPIWSRDCIAEARTRFLDKPDEWKGPGFFDGKLKRVLAGSPPEVYQLVGEALYATYLIVYKTSVGRDKKIENINRVLGWSCEPVKIPNRLHAGLCTGIMTPARFAHYGVRLAVVIEFVEQWKEMGLGARFLDRDDPESPWDFQNFVMEMPIRKMIKGYYTSYSGQRMALLHLAHPDSFEAMIITNKRKVAKAPAFQRFTSESIKDPDRKIQQIRAGLESEIGHVDFWSEEIRPLWDDNQNNGDGQ